MSTERLLQAADRLDTVSALVTVDPGMGVIATEPLAALLRCVAATHELQPGEPDDGPCVCPEFQAALALADEILEEKA